MAYSQLWEMSMIHLGYEPSSCWEGNRSSNSCAETILIGMKQHMKCHQMIDKYEKAIFQWWKISKYLAFIDHVALRGSLITHCITFMMQLNVVMGKQLT